MKDYSNELNEIHVLIAQKKKEARDMVAPKKAELEEQLVAAKAELDILSSKQAELEKDNSAAIEKEKSIRRKEGRCKGWLITVIIFGIIGALLSYFKLENLILAGAIAGVVLVLAIILGSKVKGLSKQWHIAYSEMGEVNDARDKTYNKEDEIRKIQKQIKEVDDALNKALEELDREERAAKFSRDHQNTVLVCVKGTLVASKPKESNAKFFPSSEGNALIFIDDIEVGSAQAPYATFMVNPGVHSIKVIGGFVNPIETTAKQFRADDDCTMLYVYYGAGTVNQKPYYECKAELYRDPKEFEAAIGQKII